MCQRTLLEGNDRFPNIICKSALKERLIERKEIMCLLQEETSNLDNLLSIPYLLVIVDPDGIMINYFGADLFKAYFERSNIRNGTSFAMKHAGINAISLAMERQSASVVIGDRHSNKMFAELSSVCTPIRIKNKNIGYLSLYFHYLHEVTIALPLIEHLAKNIEENYLNRPAANG
ncbi:hypothetical protein [Bacillus sp. JCM 19034]|uniref:hypothetical protein n=1 Tax=Bacillus sp. JCM 19034 TaxID=1481928 RepID=UPI00078380F0|nr:hypothetical protein [Bacillus sp. JCM 19034]